MLCRQNTKKIEIRKTSITNPILLTQETFSTRNNLEKVIVIHVPPHKLKTQRYLPFKKILKFYSAHLLFKHAYTQDWSSLLLQAWNNCYWIVNIIALCLQFLPLKQDVPFPPKYWNSIHPKDGPTNDSESAGIIEKILTLCNRLYIYQHQHNLNKSRMRFTKFHKIYIKTSLHTDI